MLTQHSKSKHVNFIMSHTLRRRDKRDTLSSRTVHTVNCSNFLTHELSVPCTVNARGGLERAVGVVNVMNVRRASAGICSISDFKATQSHGRGTSHGAARAAHARVTSLIRIGDIKSCRVNAGGGTTTIKGLFRPETARCYRRDN